MTAGQRECYLALSQCLCRYSIADVALAMREHLLERMNVHRDERKSLPAAWVNAVNALADISSPPRQPPSTASVREAVEHSNRANSGKAP